MRTCGDCTLCCKVMVVKSMSKPRGVWCSHCTKKACAIYEERPDDCRQFNCLWLKVETLPDELRPDKCGFVMTALKAPDMVEIHIDPTSARLDHRLPAIVENLKGQGLHVIEYRSDMFRPHTPRIAP